MPWYDYFCIFLLRFFDWYFSSNLNVFFHYFFTDSCFCHLENAVELRFFLPFSFQFCTFQRWLFLIISISLLKCLFVYSLLPYCHTFLLIFTLVSFISLNIFKIAHLRSFTCQKYSWIFRNSFYQLFLIPFQHI